MMPGARSRFVDLPGRRLHVLQWGDNGAPAIVLVHGIRDHAHSWDAIAAGLAGGHRVIAPDLRGHGDSDWMAAYDVPDYVRDLAELVTALGLTRIALVGHSLGGHIALRYTASFPEHVACLCAIEGVELPIIRDQRRAARPYPARLREWIGNEAARVARAPRHYATLVEAQARMAEAHRDLPAETIAQLTLHGTVADGERGLRWKYDNAARYRAPEDAHGTDLDDMLDAIACPALLAYGDDSWIAVPPAHRLQRLRRHRVVSFAQASHWLHLQHGPAFLATLAAFLASPDAFVGAGADSAPGDRINQEVAR